MNKNHEQQRKKLWCDVYVAYVGTDNSTDPDGASCWADKALKRFDKRFPAPTESEGTPAKAK
jgi:hypothetical protein